MKFPNQYWSDSLMSKTLSSLSLSDTEDESLLEEKLHPNMQTNEQQLIAQLIAENQQLKQELNQNSKTIKLINKELNEYKLIINKLQEDCIRDPLTGLFNRRYLEESLRRELLRAQRLNIPLGIMMIDLDSFKQLNDQYSHSAGDKVLQVIGKFLQQSIRGSDIPCRYGGEELTLILPDANLKQTESRAEQIRQGIKQLIIEYQGKKLPSITASFGVASYPKQGTTGPILLSKADAALYCAKAQGKDCVSTNSSYQLTINN